MWIELTGQTQILTRSAMLSHTSSGGVGVPPRGEVVEGGAGEGARPQRTALAFKHQAAAVIGIAGAVGAFGGFLIQVAFRQASLGVSGLVKAAETPTDKLAVAQSHADWALSALWLFAAVYVVFAGLTWFFYLRKSVAVGRVPSLAYASV